MELGLTEADLEDLRALAGAWSEARLRKDFGEADRLRGELIEWGAYPPERGWHPVFESPEHRLWRLSR